MEKRLDLQSDEALNLLLQVKKKEEGRSRRVKELASCTEEG